MAQYIDKDDLVAEIERRIKHYSESAKEFGDEEYNDNVLMEQCKANSCEQILSFINTLEVKDSYEQIVQYDSIKVGIQAHAETYSFNIESKLFNQLTEEQQKLWRKEIEQACISGGEVGVELARDTCYKENLEVKEADLEKEAEKYADHITSELYRRSDKHYDKEKKCMTSVLYNVNWSEICKEMEKCFIEGAKWKTKEE